MVNLVSGLVEVVVGLGSLGFILPLLHPFLLVIIMFSVSIDSILDFWQNQLWRKIELIESRQSEQRWELKWRLNAYFSRFLENGWVKQIFGIYQNRRFAWSKTNIKQQEMDKLFAMFRGISGNLLRATSIIIGGWLFLRGDIAIGTLVVIQPYIDRIRSQLKGLGQIFRNIVELRFELFRYDFLLHLKPKLDYTKITKPKFKTINSIKIQGLGFTYPEFYKEEKEYFKKMRKKLVGKKLSFWKQEKFNKEIDELEKMFAKSGTTKLF
jgi:ABC-type bacteriocin/lantibiotic exporter with double-glycine peptidase domain